MICKVRTQQCSSLNHCGIKLSTGFSGSSILPFGGSATTLVTELDGGFTGCCNGWVCVSGVHG